MTERDNKFKNTVKDLAESSSLHGVPKIVTSRQLAVKVLWSLLFLATFGVFLLQLTSLFKEYYSFPIKTKVSLEFSPLKFPAITFCNMNPIKKSQLEQAESLNKVFQSKIKRKKETTGQDEDTASGGTRKRRRKRRAFMSSSSFLSTAISSPIQPSTSVMSSSVEPSTSAMSSSVQPSTSVMSSIQLSTSTMASVQPSTSILSTSVLSSSIQPSTSAMPPSVQPSRSLMSSSVQASSSLQASSSAFAATVQPSSSIQPSSIQASSPFAPSSVAISSSSLDISPSSVESSIGPSSSAYYRSGSGSGSGSRSGSGSGDYEYYYVYDYWGNYWNHWSYWNNRDDYSSNHYSSRYSNYYSSSYHWTPWDSGVAQNDYFLDQLHSPKDLWDERILSFQTQFRNYSAMARGAMGHSVDSLVHSVSFARILENASLFEQVTTSAYGNCYTMTSPKYIAWRSGPTHGIKLTLNLEIDEYIQNFATGYGIRMVFHEPGTYPLPEDQGLTLSPGYETSIGLRMVKVSRLGRPYGNCSDGKDFMNKYKVQYSISACMMFCRISMTAESCGCVPAEAPDIELHINTSRICDKNDEDDKKCALAVDLLFDDGTSHCDCISPCHSNGQRPAEFMGWFMSVRSPQSEIVYDKTMSGTRWPKDDYLENVLMKDICQDNNTAKNIPDVCHSLTNKSFNELYAQKYRYNFVRVLIYYEDLNFESITQEKLYEATRFLSDIGGAMGLFMGASLLSFVEILHLLLEVVLYLYKRGMPTTAVDTVTERNRKDSVYPERTLENFNHDAVHKATRDPSYIGPV